MIQRSSPSLVFFGTAGGMIPLRGVFAEALCRRAAVVLATPGGVPRKCDDNEADKHDGGVIDAGSGDGEVRWHAKQGDGEDRPG